MVLQLCKVFATSLSILPKCFIFIKTADDHTVEKSLNN